MLWKSQDAIEEIISYEYAITDEIWNRRVNLDSVTRDYGKEVTMQIIKLMPNLLVRSPWVPDIDELAGEFGIQIDDLVEKFCNYIPKKVRRQQLEELFNEEVFDDDPFEDCHCVETLQPF